MKSEMTRFLIQTAGVKPLLAVIATHGLTDLDSRAWIGHYLLLAVVPLPSPVVTATFCAASVSHFADDLGLRGSLALHAGVTAVGISYGVQAAFRIMITYLAIIHVPMHFARCVLNGRVRGAKAVGMLSIIAAGLGTQLGEWVPLTDNMQRTVIAHIMTEYYIAAGVVKGRDRASI